MDYAQLQTTIANLINRPDLVANIPTFIEMAEAQFNRDIRHWRMENRAYVTANTRYLTLPPFWVETIRVQNNDTNMPLDIMSRQAMQQARGDNPNPGTSPAYYRHSEDAYELYPAPGDDPGTAIEVEYYNKIFNLGQDELDTGTPITSNWLLADSPDIYVYGSAIHSAPFLHDDARIQTWAALAGAAISALNATARRSEMSGSSPRLLKRGMKQSYSRG